MYQPISNTVFARGTFGEVSLALSEQDRQIYAVKTISAPLHARCEEDCLKAEVFSEIHTLKICGASSHKNITPLLYANVVKNKWGTSNDLHLVFPYCPCDLSEALRFFKESKNKIERKMLPMNIIKAITRDILSGLAHCHSFKIIHGDMKPGNILISNSGRAQLCDFGLAHPFPSKQNASDNNEHPPGLCTLNYRSPELLYGSKNYGGEIDVFGAGLILAELLSPSTNPLFNGNNVFDQLGKIFDVLGTPNETNWPSAKDYEDFQKVSFQERKAVPLRELIPRLMVNANLENLLSSMLSLNPDNRPKCSNCLSSSWFISDYPEAAKVGIVLMYLVPKELRKPLAFFNDDDSIRWARKVANERKANGNKKKIIEETSLKEVHKYHYKPSGFLVGCQGQQ